MSMTDSSNVLSGTPEEPYALAIDAMGGDGGPEVVVAGLAVAADRHPGVRILLIGDEARLKAILPKHPKAAAICTIRHAASAIAMDMKPTAALRVRDSSMRFSMDAVANGDALGVVSAGNSGAMLALAKIVIKTLPGISRPAMAAINPTMKGDAVMLDLGANVTCDWRNLVEFAVMGCAFAKAVLGLPAPTIGLLNVGSEELKGDEKLRQAAEALRESPLASQFYGFVEGHDITAGTTDVVVTDGFTGNVALKTGEGTMKLASGLFKQVFTSSLLGRIGYLLVRPSLERMRDWLDPRRYNGAVFVGLNGVVVKSHGGTDAEGFASAFDVAMDMVTHGFNESIREGLLHMPSLTGGKSAAGQEREDAVLST
ncbi:glycerol-3-phosphate acyltransferase PlsX [Acetobacter nitrogenifigens DSM 23921 = NBRC 105050]|uniref:Phosphate acyltransferase n=1 Tax=Acetobacter nitrogenifigens DSM 23921 = NBRC 105050 TaxID=1120919 RepID=A0A511X8X4_9PROT|nr:phosphate acyltransferase PlsX [Acetobacter nitrogenifigens]GBQ87354.1 glycerol-3-phosphate acyltransferase PlsX [Acetobacter nitrogenifigens DSM 23921 = NBRC 105050]GEN59371.1 phosphate acyltransferase [Acetobacter nitrogenifigens DSM 23921 = NBRC 105050]